MPEDSALNERGNRAKKINPATQRWVTASAEHKERRSPVRRGDLEIALP